MTPNRDPQRRALRWTPADLDAFTSPEALMAAQDEIAQAWRRDAAPADRGMIDAPEAEPDRERPTGEPHGET
jgi:hypothetical protein